MRVNFVFFIVLNADLLGDLILYQQYLRSRLAQMVMNWTLDRGIPSSILMRGAGVTLSKSILIDISSTKTVKTLCVTLRCMSFRLYITSLGNKSLNTRDTEEQNKFEENRIFFYFNLGERGTRRFCKGQQGKMLLDFCWRKSHAMRLWYFFLKPQVDVYL